MEIGREKRRSTYKFLSRDTKARLIRNWREMCFQTNCQKCGKQSWAGCGKHLQSVYNKIDKGNHCMCRSWPGIVIPSQGTTPSQNPPPASSGTSSAPPAAAAKKPVNLGNVAS